jgi:hypothetical protein
LLQARDWRSTLHRAGTRQSTDRLLWRETARLANFPLKLRIRIEWLIPFIVSHRHSTSNSKVSQSRSMFNQWEPQS